jgi:hypothetical protein
MRRFPAFRLLNVLDRCLNNSKRLRPRTHAVKVGILAIDPRLRTIEGNIDKHHAALCAALRRGKWHDADENAAYPNRSGALGLRDFWYEKPYVFAAENGFVAARAVLLQIRIV